MSNSFAIATVTATLRDVLQGEIDSDISGVEVTLRSPGIIQNPKDILNLFLYQVTPNNGYSNLDLPSRSYNGDLTKKTILGLDLYLLLTAFSETDDLKAHRIIAIAMRTLHENPVLTREAIHHSIIGLPEEESDTSDLQYHYVFKKASSWSHSNR